jgi:hypothetical protein
MAAPAFILKVNARRNGETLTRVQLPIWPPTGVGIEHNPVPTSAWAIKNDPFHQGWRGYEDNTIPW